MFIYTHRNIFKISLLYFSLNILLNPEVHHIMEVKWDTDPVLMWTLHLKALNTYNQVWEIVLLIVVSMFFLFSIHRQCVIVIFRVAHLWRHK